MIDVSRLNKIVIAISSLIEIQAKRIIYCWKCGESGLTKNDSNYPKKKKALHLKKPKSLKK